MGIAKKFCENKLLMDADDYYCHSYNDDTKVQNENWRDLKQLAMSPEFETSTEFVSTKI